MNISIDPETDTYTIPGPDGLALSLVWGPETRDQILKAAVREGWELCRAEVANLLGVDSKSTLAEDPYFIVDAAKPHLEQVMDAHRWGRVSFGAALRSAIGAGSGIF